MENKTTFRRATEEDAFRFYKGPPPASFRGWVAEKEGEIVALGGLYYSHFTPIAFSDITDAFRENKADVVRGCRILMQQISKVRGPVFAVANPAEPTSVALLARLGWKPTGRFCDLGELLKRG